MLFLVKMMSNKTEFILCLSKIQNCGPIKIKDIMSRFLNEGFLELDNLKSIIDENYSDIDTNNIGVIHSAAKAEIERCEEQSIMIKNYLDEDYPKSLSAIKDSPILIFIRGSDAIFASEEKNIAIIGTRKPSEDGKKIAFDSAKLLSEKGYCIISGLANGCDTQAHKGCLDQGGLTVAVLAHGLDIITPSSNTKLAQDIIEKGGTLISEYSIETPPQKFMYIQRNRIQSALSKIVILIESDIRGGSMKTMEFAKKQGKEIWIYQPNIFGESTTGNEKLINESSTINEKQGFISGLEEPKSKYKYFKSIDDIRKIL
jgi:DNA processing protein